MKKQLGARALMLCLLVRASDRKKVMLRKSARVGCVFEPPLFFSERIWGLLLVKTFACRAGYLSQLPRQPPWLRTEVLVILSFFRRMKGLEVGKGQKVRSDCRISIASEKM
jgi:hypothetical protein